MSTASRRTAVLGLSLALTALASSCMTTRGQRYHYNVAFDSPGQPWTEASHTETKAVMTREYVRRGETLRDWRELLTVQVFDRARSRFPAPAQAEDSLRRQMAARCPGVVWDRVAADSASVLYEWRVAGCPGEPDRQEIARVFEGRGARARVAYARRGAPMSDSLRAEWVRRLDAARFTTSPAR